MENVQLESEIFALELCREFCQSHHHMGDELSPGKALKKKLVKVPW